MVGGGVVGGVVVVLWAKSQKKNKVREDFFIGTPISSYTTPKYKFEKLWRV